MNKKILSIIIPFFNSEKTINRTLDSILKMKKSELTYFFEVIIVDDGSKNIFKLDKTYEKLDIKLFRISNSGPMSARCYGINKSSGEYIYFCDSDDELSETFFEDMCKAYTSKPDIILVDFFDKFSKKDYTKIVISNILLKIMLIFQKIYYFPF